MANIFQKVMTSRPRYSNFDMRHDVKTSFRMGELVPVFLQEAVPGDTWTLKTDILARLAPLISPVMHRIMITLHYFYVPYRILWPTWDKWIRGDSYAWPYMNGLDALAEGDLGEYLGIPPGVLSASAQLSPLPVAAYYKIYDDYYRDQDKIAEKFIEVQAGDNTLIDALATAPLLKRAWMHDYFTSAMTESQAGSIVSVPLVDTAAPVELDPATQGTAGLIRAAGNHSLYPNADLSSQVSSADLEDSGSSDDLVYDPNGTLVADVQATATDIIALRYAYALQEFLEKSKRGGERPNEFTKIHFGISPGDARIDKPEYICGSKANMVISEVLQTAETREFDSDTVIGALGTMAGHGIGVNGSKRKKYTAKEFGVIMGILNVQPVTAYQDGIHKLWRRQDNLDHMFPEFAHVGEQEITVGEVWMNTDGSNFTQVFGYIPRYAEYRFANSMVSGKFRSDLAHWHLGRIFSTEPVLNESFVECNPSDRIFADQTAGSHHIYAQVIHSAFVRRALPKYGNPSF